VYDVLGWLAAGMSYDEILDDFPELIFKLVWNLLPQSEHRFVVFRGVN